MNPRSQAVLVVDDDRSIRFLCRVNLELDGWQVLEAATLAEARNQIAEGDVDLVLVLLDLHVGAGRGLDLLAELRAVRPDVPVALLTGSAEAPAEAGADAVISKPFTLDELRETVHSLVARRARSAG